MNDEADLYNSINEVFYTHFTIVHNEADCIPVPCSIVEDTILNHLRIHTARRHHIGEFLEEEGSLRGVRSVFVKHLEEYFPTISTDVCDRVKNRCRAIHPFHPQRLECYINVKCVEEDDTELEPVKFCVIEYLNELRTQIRSRTSIHELYTLQKKLASLLTKEASETDETNETSETSENITVDVGLVDQQCVRVRCVYTSKDIYEGVADTMRVRIYRDLPTYLADILGAMPCAEPITVDWMKEGYVWAVITCGDGDDATSYTTYAMIDSNAFLKTYATEEQETIHSFEEHGMLVYCKHPTRGFYVGVLNESVCVEEVVVL